MLLFQALLQGEEGLAVVRHADAERRCCELWVPAAREAELMAWLGSLPADLQLRVLAVRHWDREA